jgi:hypothetical protein
VRVRSGGDEQRRVLIDGRVSSAHRHHAQDERVIRGGGGIGGVEANARRLEDERRRPVETERFPIRVLRRDHDAEVAVAVRERKRRRRIEREPNAVRRECDTRIHVHAIRDGDSQAPADVTETDGASEIEHGVSQSILQMREMLGGDSQSVEKLRMGIGSHRSVLRRP